MRVSERAEKCVHERTQRDLCRRLLLVPPPLVDHGPFVRLELAFRARGLLRFKEPMTSHRSNQQRRKGEIRARLDLLIFTFPFRRVAVDDGDDLDSLLSVGESVIICHDDQRSE